jgi:hypothetical protein
MANTIITKNSATATAVPTAGQLVQGELAVNVTDKRLFTENSGGTVVELGVNPSSVTTGNLTASGTLGVTGAGSVQGLTVGRGAGAVSTNTAVGASALAANTTGASNTTVGNSAGFSNVDGASLTAVGLEAGYSNTSGPQ